MLTGLGNMEVTGHFGERRGFWWSGEVTSPGEKYNLDYSFKRLISNERVENRDCPGPRG